ncbi:glycosyltransferase family 2 protein [Cohnella silvisoli]|uniref:Glycosyltransferase family 2 protein n=1 Tax=Cohnella silvisoli TaxID=2873699 RepID=A0ABV1L1U3_9BACL|nr:glycosyltransferase family 2 protein [Cohnella silvisoli]MCD9025965.1 glycosyltransferase family 2 protein [Cohnella silvisoli]
MKKATIVIPTYNQLDFLQGCISSIRKHTDIPYEIIVVDSASTDGTVEWCRREKVPFISLPRNEGFSVACNKGLLLSSGDTLVLLNSYTLVTHGWLSNLSAALYSGSDIGIVGPITNYASGPQQAHYPFENIDEFQRIAAEVNVSNPNKWKRFERVVGICFVFHRELMDKIGLLDEQFSVGDYEYDDFCLRAKLVGYSILVCHDTLIYHEGSATLLQEGIQEQQKLVERNYQLFMDKW